MINAISSLAGASVLDIDIKSYVPLIVMFFILGAVFFLFKIFRVGTKLLWRLLINGLLGIFMLFLFNLFFDVFFGMDFFHIDINWVSAVAAGTLGVPGVLLLLALKWIV